MDGAIDELQGNVIACSVDENRNPVEHLHAILGLKYRPIVPI